MSLPNYKIYSCDDHLDIYFLPVDLFSSRFPKSQQADIPHVEQRGEHKFWVCGDRILGPSGSFAGVPSALDRVDVENRDFRPSNPKQRIEDMDLDGIHASIVYGPSALFGYQIDDPKLLNQVIRVWNDWAAEEFNSYMPDRLSALPSLPPTSPEEAVEELHRVLGLGHRGALFAPTEADVGDPAWDRLWAAASEADVPISFHLSGAAAKIDPRQGGWRIPAFATVAPMQLDEPFAVMMFSGALERNPGLKLVLAESGVGWLPYMVARMDAEFEKHAKPYPEHNITTLPSEIWKRQCFATFEEEPLGQDLIPLLGADNFMWACDYPHPDSTWPNSRKAIEHALGNLPFEDIQKITATNCQRLYKL